VLRKNRKSRCPSVKPNGLQRHGSRVKKKSKTRPPNWGGFFF
jgi:hypothetical protein